MVSCFGSPNFAPHFYLGGYKVKRCAAGLPSDICDQGGLPPLCLFDDLVRNSCSSFQRLSGPLLPLSLLVRPFGFYKVLRDVCPLCVACCFFVALVLPALLAVFVLGAMAILQRASRHRGRSCNGFLDFEILFGPILETMLQCLVVALCNFMTVVRPLL